ncbi:UNVERIFIED_CONTAM: hypothetical protein Sindi_2323500 [Sesamum indicum]
MQTPTGDDEDETADDWADEDESGRRLVTGGGGFSGEKSDFRTQNEKLLSLMQIDGMMEEEGEAIAVGNEGDLADCFAQDGDGRKRFSDEEVTASDLNFQIGKIDYPTMGEQASIAGINNEDSLMISYDLGVKTMSGNESPFLGFREDEGLRRENSTETCVIPANNRNGGSVKMTGTSTNLKDGILTLESLSIEAPQKLGFRGSSPPNNGGCDDEPLNLEEFLRLAHTVIDKGDEKAVKALLDLKTKWMRRFQVKPTQSWISSKVGGEPPRATAVHQPRRCLLPSRTTSISSENLGNEASRQQVSNAPDTGFFAEKDVPLLPPASAATGRNAPSTVELPQDADVSNPSQAGAELENRVSKDVEGNDIIADVTSAATVDLLTDDVTADSADISSDVSLRNSLKKMLPSLANHAPTGLFIGNFPLHEHGNSVIDDKITQDFNNSSRKTLSCIAPLTQNGEVVVRPSLDTVRDGAKRWKTTAVGYFLGKRP